MNAAGRPHYGHCVGCDHWQEIDGWWHGCLNGIFYPEGTPENPPCYERLQDYEPPPVERPRLHLVKTQSMSADMFGFDAAPGLRTNDRPEAAALVEVLQALRGNPAVA